MRGGDGRHDIAQRALAVRRLEGTRSSTRHRSVACVRAESDSAKVSRRSTASVTVGRRGNPQREVVRGEHAGVAVVGVALRVVAPGGLEVDPADPAPADGHHGLGRRAGARGRVGDHPGHHHRADRASRYRPRSRSTCRARAAGRRPRARRCAPGSGGWASGPRRTGAAAPRRGRRSARGGRRRRRPSTRHRALDAVGDHVG